MNEWLQNNINMIAGIYLIMIGFSVRPQNEWLFLFFKLIPILIGGIAFFVNL